jgi:hypothetical protein
VILNRELGEVHVRRGRGEGERGGDKMKLKIYWHRKTDSQNAKNRAAFQS